MHDNPITIATFFFSRKRAPNVLNHTRTYPDAGTWTSIVVVRESDLKLDFTFLSPKLSRRGSFDSTEVGANQPLHERIDDPLLASGKTET